MEPCVGRVLLTNDDGVDAPGMAALEEIAREVAREVWVVAPEHDQSGTSHSVSLHAPLRLSQRGERRFGVGGTPGDCVVMAVRHLMADAPPDLVLSGVNRGANVGVETVFSGTVGAAMTALLLGLPAIALSQAFSQREPVRWEVSRRFGPPLVRRLVAIQDWSGRACLNVNFPHADPGEVGPAVATRQGAGLVRGIDVVARTDPRGLSYHWLQFRRGPGPDGDGSEAAAIAAGRIAVTPLRFERTDDEAMSRLARAMAGPA